MLHAGGLNAGLGLVDAGFDLSRQTDRRLVSQQFGDACKGEGEAHSIVNYPLNGD